MTQASTIWHKGQWVPWEQATVHVLTHGLHYGSVVFEGIRVYDVGGAAVAFRVEDHIDRLFDSARICLLDIAQSREELAEVCCEVVRRNGLTSSYVRPIAYRGHGTLRLFARDAPVEVSVAAIPWTGTIDQEAAERGIDVGVSSWRRAAADTTPAFAKSAANYLSSQLIGAEARRHGYGDGIGLDVHGHISEAAGQNVFIVRRGTLLTPPLSSSILEGITRDSVLVLARSLGIPVREEVLLRELMYVADEVFLTSTASEITAVRSVDGITVGSGKRGPITMRIVDALHDVITGRSEDRWRWLRRL